MLHMNYLIILFMTKGHLVTELCPATCQSVKMPDCGDCVAVDDIILTVDLVALLSDSPYSELLAHDVVCSYCCCFC